MTRQPPPPSALEAFDASGPLVPLEGGQGSAWRSGNAVLKLLDPSEKALAWQAEACQMLDVCEVARRQLAQATRSPIALKPVAARSQLIHGDLTGNVLFDDRLPPAVIDLAPYWRSTAFASAIVVADALVWEGADEGILDAVTHIADFDQYLLRALIYRAVTDRLFRIDEPVRPDDADPSLPAVELACRLAAQN
jgi:hypothetical protein